MKNLKPLLGLALVAMMTQSALGAEKQKGSKEIQNCGHNSKVALHSKSAVPKDGTYLDNKTPKSKAAIN